MCALPMGQIASADEPKKLRQFRVWSLPCCFVASSIVGQMNEINDKNEIERAVRAVET